MHNFKITEEQKKTIPWKLGMIFLLFAAGIFLLGFSYYKSQRNRIYKEYQENLAAISSLKIGQIIQWHNERLWDAEVIRNNGPLVNRIKEYFRDENQPGVETELKKWMESLDVTLDYVGVTLMDTSMKTRLEVTLSEKVIANINKDELGEMLQDMKVRMTDLRREVPSDKAHMDLLIPLVETSSKVSKPFGIVIIRIDPGKVLFPLIQSWPTSSKSSETLLVRKEGDSVLFLNELRHIHNTAMNLRFPLSDENLPATMAVRGIKGMVEGYDYRNVPVVGYISSIPDLPWLMVAKIDKAEILVLLKRYLIITVIITVLLIFINASIFGFWIWEQRVKQYRRQLNNELAREKVDEALIDSETRYRRLFESAKDGILILDAGSGMIVDVNPFLIEMLGFSREKFLEKTIWEIGFFTDIVENKEKFLELQKKDYVRYDDLPLKTADGRQINVEFVSNVYKVDHHLVIQCNIRDITERKVAESQIKNLNEELEQRVIERTQQFEAANKDLEAFSYSVSHDLRAPLRSVHGFTKILLEDYEQILDDEGKRICGIISSGAAKMGELIDDLLSFSRIGRSSLHHSLLDMKSMAGSVFSDITNEKERAKTKLQIGNLHKVSGDANLISLVWNNLISNAIKYSSKETSPEITIGSKHERDSITFFIRDNGVGFDMQYKHKLFGVFQRLHNENDFEGNGVGLATVQRILLKHNGRAWAEGEVGKGATFYFSLPADARNLTPAA